MADPWTVVGETPAPAAADPWKVVGQTPVPQAAAPPAPDQWTVVGQTPAAPAQTAPTPDPDQMAARGLGPRGETTPQAPTGIGRRISEGASQGFGEEPTGISEANLTKYPWLRDQHMLRAFLGAADSFMRAPGGAIGAAAGGISGLAEKFGMSPTEADKLMRDLGVVGTGLMVEAGRPGERVAAPKVKEVTAPEPVKAPLAAASPEVPPLAPGDIRFYHGTAYDDASTFTGKTFVTPHYEYAKNYHGGDNNVLYVDMSKEEAIRRGLYDEINDYPRSTGSIDDGAAVLKPLKPVEPKPVETPSTVPSPPEAWKVTHEEPISAAPKETPPETMNAAQATARKIREIFNPEAVSPAAEDAAARIRSAGGQAVRDTESTRAAFEQVQHLTRNLTDEQKIALNDYIENRSTGKLEIDEALKPVADVLREAMLSRRAKIENLGSTATAEFIQDYLPHIYKDPEAARQVFSGPAKEGTGRFLKKRSIPTLKEAMARGIEPATLDPLEMGQRYADSMDRFIATRQTLEGAIKDGHVKAYPPGEQPTGWVEVNTKYGGSNMPYYAPADWARIYNNFVDRGWNKSETWGPVLNSVQRTANAVTSLKLGLSGYHAVTMAKEAYASGLDLAVAQLASGKPLKAAVSAAKAPTKFVTNAIRGKQVKDVYLGRTEGTPEMRQIVSLLTEGGGRMSGNRHAPDYRYSAMDSYWNTFKRGTAKVELAAAKAEARKAYGLGTVKVLAQQFGRIMQTTAKPLFEHYIPALKNGAAYDMMSAWLDANPTADHATQVKAARKIVDAIDDRFGEMISDNIFWNKAMKQSLQAGMLSYSWMLGSARALGGGTASLVRNPARLSMKHPDWKPQANYALAFPIVAATSAMVYQFLKTGTVPDSVDDLLGPWTGGWIGTGKNKAKERARTPGYEKEVLGWWHAPLSEAYHKLNPIIQMPIELAMNKDWKNQPIRHEGAPVPEQVKQILAYIYHSLNPISVEKLQEGRQKGSKISKPEQLLGISNAPAWLQNPNAASASKYFAGKDWRKKENWDKSKARKMEP